MEFRTIYGERYVKKGETFELPSRTLQEPKDSCDINLIMQRYQETGLINHVSNKQPIYDDVSSVGDYQSCLDVVERAHEAFAQLPSDLRKTLDNNPANLIGYISNPDNFDACVKFGLFNAPPERAEPKNVVTPKE